MSNEVFFTSDTHFFHDRILEFTDRPFASVEEMNEGIVDRWNATVAKGDRVYHLGDFSFGSRTETRDIIPRLRGQIHLIRGNHDDVLDRYADRFVSYQTYKEIRVGTQKLILFHFPIESWNGAHRGAWHLHGHCHGTLADNGSPRMDVGVDTHDCRPYTFHEIADRLQEREWIAVDHHTTLTGSNES